MSVFLILSMLYPNDTQTELRRQQIKDLSSCKSVLEAIINSKGSLPVLKWTSESDYYFSFKLYFAVQEQLLDPLLRMHGAG